MNKLNEVFNRVKIISNYKKDIISILELGTHKGEFAKELYNHFKPTKMVLVDPWKYETEHIYQKSWFGGSEMVFIGQSKQDKIYEDVKNMFKKEIDEKTIEIFRGNSDEFFKLNNVFFDLIYIDGNHLYDFIKKDFNKIYHQKDFTITHSLKYFKKTGNWKSLLLTNLEKKYLENNIDEFELKRNYNFADDLAIITKIK